MALPYSTRLSFYTLEDTFVYMYFFFSYLFRFFSFIFHFSRHTHTNQVLTVTITTWERRGRSEKAKLIQSRSTTNIRLYIYGCRPFCEQLLRLLIKFSINKRYSVPNQNTVWPRSPACHPRPEEYCLYMREKVNMVGYRSNKQCRIIGGIFGVGDP